MSLTSGCSHDDRDEVDGDDDEDEGNKDVNYSEGDDEVDGEMRMMRMEMIMKIRVERRIVRM